jgi:inner membrane protein
VLCGGLFFGLLLNKLKVSKRLSTYRASAGVAMIFATHIIIDYFTIYGTQLLAPFSRHGFARGNMFIIDPLFTMPLLAGIIAAGAVKGRIGWLVNVAGISLSSLYAIFSLLSHAYADHIFKHQLADRNVTVIRSMTGATPFNTFLWRHVARTPDGFLIGYFSIIGNDPDAPIRFDYVPQNSSLVEDYKGQRNVEVLEWFSKGFWIASQKDSAVKISDIRFGEFRSNEYDPPDKWQFVFAWAITENPQKLIRQPRAIRNSKAALSVLWGRLIGITS